VQTISDGACDGDSCTRVTPCKYRGVCLGIYIIMSHKLNISLIVDYVHLLKQLNQILYEDLLIANFLNFK